MPRRSGEGEGGREEGGGRREEGEREEGEREEGGRMREDEGARCFLDGVANDVSSVLQPIALFSPPSSLPFLLLD